MYVCYGLHACTSPKIPMLKLYHQWDDIRRQAFEVQLGLEEIVRIEPS